MDGTSILDRLRRSKLDHEQREDNPPPSDFFSEQGVGISPEEKDRSADNGRAEGHRWAIETASWKEAESVADLYESHMPDGVCCTLVPRAFPTDYMLMNLMESRLPGDTCVERVCDLFLRRRFEIQDAEAFSLAFIESVAGAVAAI